MRSVIATCWYCAVTMNGVIQILCVILYKLINMFRTNMCPSSAADECVVLSPRVGIVPWLQEDCQNRLACSVSIEEFVAQLSTCFGQPCAHLQELTTA
jgi:hypothetical protein